MEQQEATKPKGITLERVQRDLMNFSHDEIMYCYHYLNGRIEEANSYLEAMRAENEALGTELVPADSTVFVQPEPSAPPLETIKEEANDSDDEDEVLVKIKKKKN